MASKTDRGPATDRSHRNHWARLPDGRARTVALTAGVLALAAVQLLVPLPACAGKVLTRDQIIGQLIITGFAGTSPGQPGPRRIFKEIQSGRIGGVILFARNIRSPAQLRKLTAYFRSAKGPFTPFIAIDEEGGRVQRLTRKKKFLSEPSAALVARRYSPQKAEAVYYKMARQLAGMGINLNFGPVVDLNINPANPVIGRLARSYGKKPGRVARYATAFIRAHRRAGVLTALKHFPGHGSSSTDSHKQFVDVTATWKPAELMPYTSLIASGMTDMIMTGHIYHKDWGGPASAPASLSPSAIRGILRQDLRFNGVAITDDLQMSAIRKQNTLGRAIVRALAAGNDIVLIGAVLKDRNDIAGLANLAIKAGIKAGRLTPARIKQAFGRVVRLKRRLARAAAKAPARTAPAPGKTAPPAPPLPTVFQQPSKPAKAKHRATAPDPGR